MKELKCPKCGATFSVDENDYNDIVKQVRDDEFKTAMQERETFIRAEMLAEAEKNRVLEERAYIEEKNKLAAEIVNLQNELKIKQTERESDISKAVADKDKEIIEIGNKLAMAEKEALLKEKNLKTDYETRLKAKEDEVAYYKDLKAKMSTKLVGETLEQHCFNEFNRVRMMAFPNAYFEKDNDASSGSKGDFIYRENVENTDTELISIMFEMKNKCDATQAKKKNEDFFKELDKDRNEKGCEYAVLVSMLEADNELYNAGIVDVSYRYPKMFVVRPQCFLAIIGLLRNAALNASEVKKELALAKNQNIDITNFEQALEDFKGKFETNYRLASSHFTTAIDEIDKTIKKLESIKYELKKVDDNLRIANDKAQNVSVKKLTKNSPSVKALFDALKKDED